MARPKGEPTKVIRVPARLVEKFQPEADRLNVGVGEVIARHLLPREPGSSTAVGTAERCACKEPTLSKVVSNLCTTCGLLRG